MCSWVFFYLTQTVLHYAQVLTKHSARTFYVCALHEICYLSHHLNPKTVLYTVSNPPAKVSIRRILQEAVVQSLPVELTVEANSVPVVEVRGITTY